MKAILLLVCLFFISCNCKKYLQPFGMKQPIISSGTTYVDLYDDYRFRVGAIDSKICMKYETSSDSINPTIGIAFIDEDSTSIVSVGSIFSYAKNKYEVLKIFSKRIWIDGKKKVLLLELHYNY